MESRDIQLNKKFMTLFLAVFLLFNMTSDISIAQEKGKVILININRTSLSDLDAIQSLKKEMDKRGYVALMNIKASKGTSDIRSYASIGAGTRSYLNTEDIDFRTLSDENKDIYLRRSAISPKLINNLNMNKLLKANLEGEFDAFPGALGYELKKNNRNIALLGNADTDLDTHREACLIAMDENGQIEKGNISSLNINDNLMPFGIRTDYVKLLEETKKYYKNNDLTVIELGDTYRLDLYKDNLNENAYKIMKESINKNISNYLNEVFKMTKQQDRIYIVSPYPKMEAYKNGYRLSPIVLFEGDGKGLLYSDTTRRVGIIGNIDIAADILNYFDVQPTMMVGKTMHKKEHNNPVDFLLKDYDKIVSTSNIRFPVLYTYAVLEMIIWMLCLIAIFFRSSIPKKSFEILSSILTFTMSIPLVLLIAPLLKLKSEISIISAVVIFLMITYYAIHKFVKEDIYKLIMLSLLVAIGVLIDGATGQNMIKNSLLGYDPIIGARYYGIGNEYMGVLIGSLILSLAGLMEKGKIGKKFASVMMVFAVVILGFPKMGANVGGTITAVFCFLYFVLTLYNIKIDIKKLAFISIAVVGVVAVMAIIDIYFIGSKSHLAGAIEKIASGGPMVILGIIQRKIAMNLKLIGISIWSKVLILGLVVVGTLFYKPFGMLKKLCDMYPYFAKGWSAIIVGTIVGFLVNDSGVISAATGIAYVIIPVLVLVIKNIDKLSQQV